MKDSALSIANYFVELAHKDNSEIKPLRLMKLVYIAHGFMLALFDRTALNPRFDKVEAWKYGPVIPSVYHSFKVYGNAPITAKTTIFVEAKEKRGDIEYTIKTPELHDKDARRTCEFVWKRYKNQSDSWLVGWLHKENTPWSLVYAEGLNNEIPDLYTKIFFGKLVNSLMEDAKRN